MAGGRTQVDTGRRHPPVVVQWSPTPVLSSWQRAAPTRAALLSRAPPPRTTVLPETLPRLRTRELLALTSLSARWWRPEMALVVRGGRGQTSGGQDRTGGGVGGRGLCPEGVQPVMEMPPPLDATNSWKVGRLMALNSRMPTLQRSSE